jgi:hypothetical protein
VILPPSEDGPPPAQEEPAAPRVWPVYLVTVAMVPLTMWMMAVLTAAPALILAGIEIAREGYSPAELALIGYQKLAQLMENKLYVMVMGVLCNVLAFSFVALAMAARNAEHDRRLPWARLRFTHVRLADVLLTVFGLLAFTNALDALIVMLRLEDVGTLPKMRELFEQMSAADRALLSLLVAIGAGIAEELYFRGFMLTRLELAHGRLPAVVITSLAFGLFHFDVVHAPVAALIGAYLAVALVTTGSLWCTIAAHVVNNLLAVMLVGTLPRDLLWLQVVSLVFGLSFAGVVLILLERRHRAVPRSPVW